MKKKLILLFFIGLLLIVAAIYFGSMQSAPLIWKLSNGGKLLFPLLVIASLVDSVNPCAFSILLLTIAFLFSIGRLRTNVLKMGGVYIFGIFLVYVLIGLGVLQTLHIFNTPHFMAKVGAILLLVLGSINLINEFWPAFPIKLRIPHAAHQKIASLMEKGSLPTAFILGILVGICEFPCSGGPYVMILGLLHDNATYLRGLIYLVIYNLIFVLPLVVILLIASDKNLLGKAQEWQQKERKSMRFWGGIAMIILAIIILFL